uniref:Uncharacterized protein n=1 Tax=Oryza sativa subsp. japonica TaxID=39947 RepID=Q8H4N6_ORYSJ|nr:hypothetical protein [Oryza sativa Japonica Group]
MGFLSFLRHSDGLRQQRATAMSGVGRVGLVADRWQPGAAATLARPDLEDAPLSRRLDPAKAATPPPTTTMVAHVDNDGDGEEGGGGR